MRIVVNEASGDCEHIFAVLCMFHNCGITQFTYT